MSTIIELPHINTHKQLALYYNSDINRHGRESLILLINIEGYCRSVWYKVAVKIFKSDIKLSLNKHIQPYHIRLS